MYYNTILIHTKTHRTRTTHARIHMPHTIIYAYRSESKPREYVWAVQGSRLNVILCERNEFVFRPFCKGQTDVYPRRIRTVNNIMRIWYIRINVFELRIIHCARNGKLSELERYALLLNTHKKYTLNMYVDFYLYKNYNFRQ